MEILYGEDMFISCRNNASIKDTSVFFYHILKNFFNSVVNVIYIKTKEKKKGNLVVLCPR